MILAVTSHDAATASNAAVCAVIHDPGEPQILGANLVGTALIDALTAHPHDAAFFVGHGQPDSCLGNDKSSVLSVADVHLLAERSTFAIACHTASALGPEAAKAGGVWCGFEGAISCLPDDEDLVEIFHAVPTLVRDQISTVTDIANAQSFANDFETMLDEIEHRLDAAGPSSMEPYLAVNLLRERLRIWIPGEAEPTRCSKSSPAATYF